MYNDLKIWKVPAEFLRKGNFSVYLKDFLSIFLFENITIKHFTLINIYTYVIFFFQLKYKVNTIYEKKIMMTNKKNSKGTKYVYKG